MSKAIVSLKGQIVIPAELRKKYGIKPQGEVEILDKEGIIYLIPLPADPVKSLRGRLKERTPLHPQEIKKELRDEEARWDSKKKEVKGSGEE